MLQKRFFSLTKQLLSGIINLLRGGFIRPAGPGTKGGHRNVKKGGKTCKLFITALLCAAVGLCLFAFALASGVEQDEEGGTWDYDRGIYTDPTGQQHPITPEGTEEGSGSSVTPGDGGAMIIDTGEEDPIPDAKRNEDGSIEIESGQGGVDIQDSPTRAPLEGEEWEALLAGIEARNGSETPTVWVDPSSGNAVQVDVVYMGIGRSMVVLNGQKMMVNTVDLKWETTADEAHVLAVIKAPKVGYAWLRKKPSVKITNPKFMQCRTDAVVRVLATGKNWTFIDYKGTRGYVQTGSLEFFYNDHVDFDTAVLSVKGKTTGKNTAHVRSRDKGMRDLGEYCVGTPVTVFDMVDDWAYVDIEGFFCRVESKYVTLEKETALAD